MIGGGFCLSTISLYQCVLRRTAMLASPRSFLNPPPLGAQGVGPCRADDTLAKVELTLVRSQFEP